ncbi:hypothetical protein Q3G72_018015 [Acer saccharum]|nr:hypothetical protein Q3G72_018015 [Acer saccharum]
MAENRNGNAQPANGTGSGNAYSINLETLEITGSFHQTPSNIIPIKSDEEFNSSVSESSRGLVMFSPWPITVGRALHDPLISWLGSAASDVGIVVVVGLQEVEMGAGVLAMSTAKETVGLEGSSVGQWLLDLIGKSLDEGSTFECGFSRQLARLLVPVWELLG